MLVAVEFLILQGELLADGFSFHTVQLEKVMSHSHPYHLETCSMDSGDVASWC